MMVKSPWVHCPRGQCEYGHPAARRDVWAMSCPTGMCTQHAMNTHRHTHTCIHVQDRYTQTHNSAFTHTHTRTHTRARAHTDIHTHSCLVAASCSVRRQVCRNRKTAHFLRCLSYLSSCRMASHRDPATWLPHCPTWTYSAISLPLSPDPHHTNKCTDIYTCSCKPSHTCIYKKVHIFIHTNTHTLTVTHSHTHTHTD